MLQPPEKVNLKPGDVVFFKRAKRKSDRKEKEIAFQGHGFGVLLGYLPPFQKDPDPAMLIRLMGSIGFMSFDDVANFLGDEFGAKCVKMFEEKYYGIPDVPPAEPSPILDASGNFVEITREEPNQ